MNLEEVEEARGTLGIHLSKGINFSQHHVEMTCGCISHRHRTTLETQQNKYSAQL